MSDPEPRCIVCAAQVDENCDGVIATCPRFTSTGLEVDENGCHTVGNGDCVSEGPCLHTTTGLDANPDDHDDGDDFEDQGGELEFDDQTDDFDEDGNYVEIDDDDEALDPEDNEGEDMPDDFQLED